MNDTPAVELVPLMDVVMPPKKNEDRSHKLQVMISEKNLKAIDSYRFKNRLPTRAAAIRSLIDIGLSNAINLDKSE